MCVFARKFTQVSILHPFSIVIVQRLQLNTKKINLNYSKSSKVKGFNTDVDHHSKFNVNDYYRFIVMNYFNSQKIKSILKNTNV